MSAASATNMKYAYDINKNNKDVTGCIAGKLRHEFGDFDEYDELMMRIYRFDI